MTLQIAPSSFELWAKERGYDTAPAVLADSTRAYAGKRTQELYEAWQAGAASIARMLTESTIETPALREKILQAAGA